MNDEIHVRYRWHVDEALRGYRWYFRHRVRPVFRWAFGVLAVAFLIAGIALWRDSPGMYPGGILIFAGIYIPVMLLVVRPWLFRYRFAQRPIRDTEIEWCISANSLHIQTTASTSDFTWAALLKVVQAPDGFLLYPTAQLFNWLPRHGFASDADFDRLSQLAQQHAAAFHRVD